MLLFFLPQHVFRVVSQSKVNTWNGVSWEPALVVFLLSLFRNSDERSTYSKEVGLMAE